MAPIDPRTCPLGTPLGTCSCGKELTVQEILNNGRRYLQCSCGNRESRYCASRRKETFTVEVEGYKQVFTITKQKAQERLLSIDGTGDDAAYPFLHISMSGTMTFQDKLAMMEVAAAVARPDSYDWVGPQTSVTLKLPKGGDKFKFLRQFGWTRQKPTGNVWEKRFSGGLFSANMHAASNGNLRGLATLPCYHPTV